MRVARAASWSVALLLLGAACAGSSGGKHAVRVGADVTEVEPTVSSTSAQPEPTTSTAPADCDKFGPVSCERPPQPPPTCPAHPTEPSFNGIYCGPPAGPGNGNGPMGVCAGDESAPPCGPGVVPGREYAYSLPGTCDGRLWLNGQRWRSMLPPVHPVPALYGWVRLVAGKGAGWWGPQGALGFEPDTGQPVPACAR